MRARELLKSAIRRLTASGSPDPEADAKWLLSDALRVHRGALPLRLDDDLAGDDLEWFEKALSRRESGEPLQYVEGFAAFYGRQFKVDPRVLIPRSDTETLCEAALGRVRPGMRALDLCTGSGILAILSLMFGAKKAVGTDLDPCAVEAVKENCESNGISPKNFEMMIGNIITDTTVQDKVGYDCYDIVVANILADVLVPLTPVIVNQLKKGGIYITSGIIDDKEQTVVEAVKKAGLEILEITYQGEWVSVTARK